MAEKKLIYGDVVSDVTIKHGQKGLEAAFQLLSERLRMSEGRWVSEGKDHRWVNVTGKQAEIARDHWGKGAAVAVYGNIHIYEDKDHVQRERIYADAVFPRLTDKQWQLERLTRTHDHSEAAVAQAPGIDQDPGYSAFDREQEAANALRFAAGMRAAGVGSREREPLNQEPENLVHSDETKLDATKFLSDLKLGVEGHGREANETRFQKAQEVLTEFEQRSDRAYESAAWNQEPDLMPPFGAELLTHHRGDLAAVVGDSRFEAHVTNALGLSSYERTVNDENGARYEWVDPADSGEARGKIQLTVSGVQQALGEELQSAAFVRAQDLPAPPNREPVSQDIQIGG